jgi:hypothetical protein
MRDKETEQKMDTIEAQCLADFEMHKHKILLAKFVIGYRNDTSVEIYCTPPARVRLTDTLEQDIAHWNDEWCDPYWDVELIEPHPALEGVGSLWVDGISRSLTGEVGIPNPGWAVDENQEPAYQLDEPAPEQTDTPAYEAESTIRCPFCNCEIHIDVRVAKKEMP